jgi:uncharacterized protein HemX
VRAVMGCSVGAGASRSVLARPGNRISWALSRKTSEVRKLGFCFMGDQSRFECPPRPDRHSRRARIFVLTLLALALIVPLGVYETIPVKQHKPTAPPPDPTAQAIHDLQTSLQQADRQITILQQTLSSERADIKRLSDDFTALTGKLEALQQSFASAQQAPAPQQTEPQRQKRATAR